MSSFFSFILLTFFFTSASFAHPEYLQYFKKESGRPINCAMCHVNPEGPEGIKPGQIGSLDAEGKKMLALARLAKPGENIKNPILNEFGNEILDTIGHDKLVELEKDPGAIPGLLSKTSDLDHNGIPDYQKLLDGTDPLNPNDGLPWKLFIINFIKNWFQILMITLATISGIFGLYYLILWFSIKAKKEFK
jgi:hypothetical protein